MGKLAASPIKTAAKVVAKIPASELPSTAAGIARMNLFSNSDDLALVQGSIVTHGPNKSGKSFLAGSISDAVGDVWPPKKKTVIDDVLWIANDEGATAGFGEYGVRIEYVLDLWRIREKYRSILDANTAMMQAAYELFNKKKFKAVVDDTVSMMDKELVDYFSGTLANSNNKFEIYRMTLITHRRRHRDLSKLPCWKIFNFHTNVMTDDDSTRSRQKASGLPGGGQYILDITGKARSVYCGNANLILAMGQEPIPGKKDEYARCVFTQPSAGFEAGSRWQVSLGKKEEPHLGKMLKKVAAQLKKSM